MLSCRNLAKSFGALAVTRGVSLEIPAGERRAIIGPNGAGKTTLFNLISGELPLDSGQILLDAVDLTGMSADRRARRGLARSFQRNSTFPDMTVAESLTVAVALARGLTWSMIRPVAGRRDVAASVHEIAATIGVADVLDVVVDELSYGTQRQLEIGLALACAPRVLMLDEPTAAMSPEETHRVQTLIAGLPRQLTVVIIEHDMDVVFSIADRVTVLDRGEILAEGTPAEIKASNLVQARYLGGLPS